jgi:hypothetical protein
LHYGIDGHLCRDGDWSDQHWLHFISLEASEDPLVARFAGSTRCGNSHELRCAFRFVGWQNSTASKWGWEFDSVLYFHIGRFWIDLWSLFGCFFPIYL